MGHEMLFWAGNILIALYIGLYVFVGAWVLLDMKLPANWGKKLVLHGINPTYDMYDIVVNDFGNLGKALINKGVVKGDNWHTVQFYVRKNGDGILLDEIKVSNIKR